jgi:ATP-dependent DNA helicase RecG
LIVLFNTAFGSMRWRFPSRARKLVSGKVTFFAERPQMTNPSRVIDPKDLDDYSPAEPVYASTDGLSQRALRGAISKALDAAEPEISAHWPSLYIWLKALHSPKNAAAAAITGEARSGLAGLEFLAGQLAFAVDRYALTRKARSLDPGTLSRRSPSCCPSS